MSVLIKGIKIPKSCGVCIFDDYGHCIMTKRYSGGSVTHGRASFCPLVELPEKHGRLIDESIVLEMIRKSMGIKDLSFLYHAEKSIVNEIYHAPTVIDAEGE